MAGCYGVRRFTIVLRISVTVKRCASSNKPCMLGGWVPMLGVSLHLFACYVERNRYQHGYVRQSLAPARQPVAA